MRQIAALLILKGEECDRQLRLMDADPAFSRDYPLEQRTRIARAIKAEAEACKQAARELQDYSFTLR